MHEDVPSEDSTPSNLSLSGEDSMNLRHGLLALAASPLLFLATQGQADGPGGYRKPPKAVSDILQAPASPRLFLSPDRQHALLVEADRSPPIRDLAQPMLR